MTGVEFFNYLETQLSIVYKYGISDVLCFAPPPESEGIWESGVIKIFNLKITEAQHNLFLFNVGVGPI
jgi:hypothetical protein